MNEAPVAEGSSQESAHSFSCQALPTETGIEHVTNLGAVIVKPDEPDLSDNFACLKKLDNQNQLVAGAVEPRCSVQGELTHGVLPSPRSSAQVLSHVRSRPIGEDRIDVSFTRPPHSESGCIEHTKTVAERAFSNTPYGVGRYGELGLSAGKELPAQPTQVARPNSPEARAQAQRNDAISVTLDDGTNRGFAASPTQEPRQVPYLTPENPVAVGDTARITAPVIVDYRFDKWRLQPTTPMVPGKEPARFSGSADPKPGVGGQVRIASFNVLNYFTTVGQDKGCRGGNYSTDGTYNVAQGCDARGAYDRADFERQQAKTVSVINKVDASVVGLMEVENSAKLGEPKDEALASLVKALNKAAGYTKWAYVPVADSELQPVAEQDFITNAIVYQPREVTQVGQARALGSEAVAGGAFENARTPIAATFTATKGGGKHGAAPTTVVVNHFKSKGSAPRTGPNRDTGDGQGAWNTSRVAQASAVVDWIPELTAAAGSQDVAVLGDFNSYAQEDPLQEFYRAGYARAAEDDYTYVFGGQVGSLDHMLISPSLAKRMTGAAAWNINSGQSPLLQYAQYRTTALDYYVPNEVASSDHDPFIAGFRAGTK